MPAPENLTVQTPGETSTTTTTENAPVVHRFIVKHKGGGRYAVFDTQNDGLQAGDFLGTEEEAIVEAKRLDAGGEPYIKPPEEEQPKETPTTTTENAAKELNPETLTRPVLTPEGWLCPAPKGA